MNRFMSMRFFHEAASGNSVAATPAHVRYIGRNTLLPDGETYGFINTNSGVEFFFEGTSLRIHLESEAYPHRLKVYIDEDEPQLLVLREGKEVTVATGLPAGHHTAKIIKVNEPNGQNLSLSLTVDEGCSISPTSNSASRKILVIGDSICCGYGILDYDDPFLAEDSTRIYPQQAANIVGNAELQTVAISGIGIARNAGNIEPHSGGALWMFNEYNPIPSDYQPDLIIIALGTNDAASSDEELVEDATVFLKTVLKAHPSAPVIWCYGLMGQAKSDAIRTTIRLVSEELAVENIHFLLHDPVPEVEGIGLAGHPALVTHNRVARELATKMREVMGW